MTFKPPYIASKDFSTMDTLAKTLSRVSRVVLTEKGNMKYNDNITIIQQHPREDLDLEEDEFYALMVTDHDSYIHEREWFNAELRFVGLEGTGGIVYISKRFEKRENYRRGQTVLVSVKDTNQCCLLI